jgi:hypothetical protein
MRRTRRTPGYPCPGLSEGRTGEAQESGPPPASSQNRLAPQSRIARIAHSRWLPPPWALWLAAVRPGRLAQVLARGGVATLPLLLFEVNLFLRRIFCFSFTHVRPGTIIGTLLQLAFPLRVPSAHALTLVLSRHFAQRFIC